MASTHLEDRFWQHGALVAGVDEAGRGCLAGPVVAAAVVLSPSARALCTAVQDSKLLSASEREELYDAITTAAVAWSVGIADVAIIDQQNILQATFHAMQEAVAKLPCCIAHVLVDGPRSPLFPVPATAIVEGDRRSASIAAASIIAKVTRDRLMAAIAAQYPHYGFEQHKGYPTKEHYRALDRWGPSPVHRRRFLQKWRQRTQQHSLL